MEFKGTKAKWFTTGLTVFSEHSTKSIHSSKNNEKEDKYNALLISKAPELLEMVDELLKELAFHNYNHSTTIYRAKELIKEATEL